MADTWVLGLMGHLGFKISVIGISLPPLIISVGSSYSIHIMNRFLIDSEKIRSDKKEGIFNSMQMVGMTLLLASVTTITGFSTNMATQVSSIFEWGVFAALGTAFAVFIASLFIPAVFTFIDIKKPRRESAGTGTSQGRGVVSSILDLCSKLSVKHPGKVIAGAAVIIAVSAAGIFQLESETSLQSYFSRSDYINSSNCEIGKKFGGTMGLNILIDSGVTDGVKDPGFLNKTEELREWLTSPENTDLHIGRTDAFGDFIRTINMAMHNDDPAFYSIPDSKTDLIDYLEIYSGNDENSDGRIDEFEPYIDPEFRTVNIFARLSESESSMLGTADISRIVEKIRTHFNSELNNSGYRVTISGEPLIIISLAKYVVRGQMWSLFLSFIAVTLIVAVLFRNAAAGLISSVPIITAVIVNFGVMGWIGIKLDIATAIIASITIGIGVDNTIHFLNTYRHAAQKYSSIDDAVHHTLTTGGKAIIFTALALIAGFSVLVISQFKPIFLFGIMMGFTFITTTAGAIIILPALIKLMEFDPEKSRIIIPRIITEPYAAFINSITAIKYVNFISIAVRSRMLRFLNSRDAD
jgi:predicted RND superfamily exporter protein